MVPDSPAHIPTQTIGNGDLNSTMGGDSDIQILKQAPFKKIDWSSKIVKQADRNTIAKKLRTSPSKKLPVEL